MPQTRNTYLDFVKGIAILLVVIGHSLQYSLESAVRFDNVLFVGIYGMHMPLFAIISGYLMARQAARYSQPELLKNKLRTIGVPAISYSLTIMILRAAIVMAKGEGSETDWWQMLDDCFLKSVWFLWAMVVISLAMCCIGRMKHTSLQMAVVVALSIAGLFAPNISILNWCFYLLPFFGIGYFSILCDIGSWPERFKLIAGLLATMIYAALLPHLCSKEAFIYNSGLCILTDNPIGQLGRDCIRFLAGIAGSISILYWLKVVHKLICGHDSLILKLGKNTLPIYGISMVFVNEVMCMLVGRYVDAMWLAVGIEVCLVLSICMLGAYLLGTYRPTRTLFLGGR